MKTLVNTFYNLELRLIENAITVLSVEAPSAYQKIMHDFWQQYNGNEGSFILSENGKELKIQKNVECIYNPFSVNLNDKKILTKRYVLYLYELTKLSNAQSIVCDFLVVLYLYELTKLSNLHT